MTDSGADKTSLRKRQATRADHASAASQHDITPLAAHVTARDDDKTPLTSDLPGGKSVSYGRSGAARDDTVGSSSGRVAGMAPVGDTSCKKHKGDAFVAYCQVCKLLLCLDCLTEKEHAAHDKVRIMQLLANPEFFSETLKSLTTLLNAKENLLHDLKQSASDVKRNHAQQIKDIRSLQQKAVDKLTAAYDVELEKLTTARDDQHKNINKVAERAVDAVKIHQEAQLAVIKGDRDSVQPTLPTLSHLTAALEQVPSAESLPSLIEANKQGEQLLTDASVVKTGATGVEHAASQLNTSDMDKFTVLGVRIAVSDETSDGDTQTDKIAGLRTKIKALVPDDVSKDNYDEAGPTKAVIDRQYHVACRAFGAGESSVMPGPYHEPDVSKPFHAYTVVTYMASSAAASLCAAVGGEARLTGRRYCGGYCLMTDDDTVVACYARLFDRKDRRLTSTTGEDRGVCYLPASARLGDALQQWLGWWPSRVTEKRTSKDVDLKMTVKEWNDTFKYVTLIVLK